MSGKFWISQAMRFRFIASLTIVLLTALLGPSVALAASPASSLSWPGNYFGQITSITTGGFTLGKNGAGGKTVQVTQNTNFVRVNGAKRSFKDLRVGQWVLVSGSRIAGDSLIAQTVMQVPHTINKGDWTVFRTSGRVTAVNLAENTFTLSTPMGLTTFVVDSNTHNVGNSKKLNSLKVGMYAFVGYKMSGGELLVRSMIAHH
jgi:hypothetical protein